MKLIHELTGQHRRRYHRTVTRMPNYLMHSAPGQLANLLGGFTMNLRNGHGSGVPLADRASGVQAVDDRVAPALLLRIVALLGSNVVGAISKWSEFVNGCL